MTDPKPYTDEDLEIASALRYSAVPGEYAALVALDPGRGERVRDATRRILDAVAPAIIRRAKAEALREVADKMAAAAPSPKFAPGWSTAEIALRVRADDIEAAK